MCYHALWCEVNISVSKIHTNEFPLFESYNRKYSYELHFSSRLGVIVEIHKKNGVKCEQSFVDIVVVVVVLKNFYRKKKENRRNCSFVFYV